MSFFDNFFGKSQQRDLSAANSQAVANINGGYDKGISAAKDYGTQAESFYQPWSQSGKRANTAYENSLGLNGDAGSSNALAMYKSARNPYFDYEADQAQRGIDRAANARGALNSGSNALAVARARMGMGYQDYNNWQGQLRGQGQMGFQADSAMSGIRQNTGRYVADSEIGRGGALASNAINYGNALAASRNTGINNLMGVAGLGVKMKGGGWGGGTPTQYGGRSPGGVYPGQSWS
jgi:hypothetical protein